MREIIKAMESVIKKSKNIRLDPGVKMLKQVLD
jgi:hypothetical protein